MMGLCDRCGRLIDIDGYDKGLHGPEVLCGVDHCEHNGVPEPEEQQPDPVKLKAIDLAKQLGEQLLHDFRVTLREDGIPGPPPDATRDLVVHLRIEAAWRSKIEGPDGRSLLTEPVLNRQALHHFYDVDWPEEE